MRSRLLFSLALALGGACASAPARPAKPSVSATMQATGSPFFESPVPSERVRRSRVPLGESPALGHSDAPLTLVEFTILNNCGACTRASGVSSGSSD